MPIPVTKGFLRTKLEDMNIGDYIVCNYTATSGVVGTFSNFGGTLNTELLASNTGSTVPNGSFYFIKADKGLLIADRVIQANITWDTLNAGKVIQGKPQIFDDRQGVIRSLTGGVAFADANGNSSTTDLSLGGYPTNNEWDKYIVNGTLNETITAGDIDVWHWLPRTCCQNTPITTIAVSTNRITRGQTRNVEYWGYQLSSENVNTLGFRPAFEYQE